MSDIHLEDSGDTGTLLEHDVGIVNLPREMQTLLNCVVGETLGVDNQWIKVPSEQVLAEVWQKEGDSVFAAYKEAVKNYPLPHIWVGYDPARSEGDEYRICTTERGYASLEQQLKEEELGLYAKANKTVQPREWSSYGSEKDIEANKLYSTRQQMGMRLTFDACSRLKQPREPLAEVDQPVVELKPSSKEVFDLVEKTLFDVAVQAVPRTLVTEVQTRRAFTRNTAVQCVDDVKLLKDLNDVTAEEMKLMEKYDDPLSQTRRVLDFRNRLSTKADMVLGAVREEEVVNLFDSSVEKDPVVAATDTHQGTEENGEERERFKEVEVFAEVSSVRGKQISSVAWHPNYSGIVAVSYVARRGTVCTTEKRPHADNASFTDDILGGSQSSLSVEDSDTESMIAPPIEKQKATMMPPPAVGLGEETAEDETLAAAEKKKLRRASDIKVWRDRTAPPLPFLHLELSKYDTETFNYEVYPEDETMDWTRTIRKKLVVLEKGASKFSLAAHQTSEEKVHIIDEAQYEKMKQKADRVERMKEKAQQGIYDKGSEAERQRKMCEQNERLKRIEEAAKQIPDVPSLRHKGQGDARKKVLSSEDEDDESGEKGDLHGVIPREILPSNLRELKQKRSPSQQKTLKKLGLSVRASLDRHKPPTLFKAALDRNPKLKATYNTVQTKAKALGLPGLDTESQKSTQVPKVGKVVQEDPDRDPCLGVENAVLLWSVCDSLLPLLVLDSPNEVNTLEFAPHDGNILAGGLSSGLIVIWDLKGKIEKAMGEDVSANLNSVRRKLERELGWSKALTSERVITARVISERENSHELPVMHLQWIHPLIHMTNAVEFVVKDPRTSLQDLSYQLISCSLYGKMKFWDLKCETCLADQEEDILVRAYAEKILTRACADLDKLNRVWKPFSTISPVQTAEKTSLSTVNMQELPTFVLTKFSVQQPRVKYRKLYSSSDKESAGQALPRYQFVGEKISSADFPRTALIGSFSGVTCLTAWTSKQGSRDSDEESRLLWKQGYHDGPVTSLGSCHFYNKVTLTSGGYEWCIWHDDYEMGPILWKRYQDVVASAVWSPFRPGVFFISRHDGVIEVWDLLKSNNACVEEIVVCDDTLTELSCSPHVSDSAGSYLAMGDSSGNLRMFSIPEHHRQYTSDELAKFQKLCDSEPARRRGNIAWNVEYSKLHTEAEAQFVSIARELEVERGRERDLEEIGNSWKFEDPAKKWASKKRALERGLNKVEERETQRFMEQQKKVFIEAAIRKKNIDKCKMELLRKPLLKKEMATGQVQERISQKLKGQQRDIENITMRKFPLIKEIIEKPPCVTSRRLSATTLPSISTTDLPSPCPSGVEMEENSDFHGLELDRLTSDEHVAEILAGVKLFARKMEETRLRWSDMVDTCDELRQWLNPLKPYMDMEQWRRLRKQYELAQQPKSDSFQSLHSDLTGSQPDLHLHADEAGEADLMSMNPSLTSLRTVTRTRVDDLSLLTFTEVSESSASQPSIDLGLKVSESTQ